jgi:hypothetical protein
MTTHDQIAARMRRKIEIVRMDAKSRNGYDAVHHDMNEMLKLIDMLERAHKKEMTDGTA